MGNLFVYGTLKDPKVQKMVFGRVEKGTPDTLDGYKKSKVVIDKKTYPIIVPSPKDSIKGLILMVTAKELKQIDEYETEAYRRKKITLKSGKIAWVYQK